jgi:hypothetical protein
MTAGFDSYDDMHFLPSGDDIAERLMTGRLSPGDAPASYAGLAGVFEALRSPASSGELGAQATVVAAMTAEVRNHVPASGQINPRRHPVLTKLLTAKVASAATVAVFGLGTAAAAATGSLPGQTSHANSHASTGLAVAASHTMAGTGTGTGTGAGAPDPRAHDLRC